MTLTGGGRKKFQKLVVRKAQKTIKKILREHNLRIFFRTAKRMKYIQMIYFFLPEMKNIEPCFDIDKYESLVWFCGLNIYRGRKDFYKSFADEQNAVFISELPKIERIVLHCIIQSQQINFHISNMLETKCTPYEALTQYYVCKVMNLENNSKNRQAIVKAFQGLAGRRIKFITSKGINVYSIFPTSFLDFKTGGTSYTLNPDILQNTELIETIKSYYNTEKLTGFDARHLLNSKIDVNIALTAIEIINEIKLKDAAQSCFSKKNISNRMTYHPQPNWWRSLCNALNKFGYQVIINPKNKDEFIVDVK